MRVIQLDPDRDSATDLVRKLQYRPDGLMLAAVVGERDNVRELCRYDMAQDKPLAEISSAVEDGLMSERLENGADPVLCRDLELAAEVLVDYSGNLGIRLIDTWSQTLDEVWVRGPDEALHIVSLCFSTDTSILYIGNDSFERTHIPNVSCFNVDDLFEGKDPSDAELETIHFDTQCRSTVLVTDPDDNWLAVGTDRRQLFLVDVARQKPTHTLQHPKGTGNSVQQLRFSPDSRSLLSLIGGNVALWDVRTANLLRWHEPGTITDVAFSADGKRIGMVQRDGDVVIHLTDTFAEVARYNWNVGPLHGIAFAPDGLTAAVGATRGQVVIWDLDP